VFAYFSPHNIWLDWTCVDSKGLWRWCITLGITEFLDFVHRPVFYRTPKKKKTFRKPDLFPSSGEGWEIPTLLGLSERSNPKHWTTYVSKLHLYARTHAPAIRICQGETTGICTIEIEITHLQN
jgi:hypothetical protein